MAPKSSKASTPSSSPANAVESLWNAYVNTTPSRLKFIDSFLAFLVLSGVIQFLYCVLVTNFPFNAFLAGSVLFSVYHAGRTLNACVWTGSRARSDSSS